MIRSHWPLVLLFIAGPAGAQEPAIPVHKLAVTPSASPIPALQYKLLPELRDTTPGNAALLYYRAFAPDWSSGVRRDKELQEKIDAALDKPATEVKAMSNLQFIRDWGMLKEVDRAARRAYCDWELTPRMREDGIGLLLPDVQGLRDYARYLKIRAKLELADGHFDKSAYTLQTGLQLGRHAAHGPTLIQGLVGVAISAVMFTEVEEWIGTPGSPNLYWALTELPQPFVDLRMAYQGERLFIDSLLPGYREALIDPTKTPPPLSGDMQRKLGDAFFNNDRSLYFMALTAKKYPTAKAYLLAHGRTAAQIEALPTLTAVLLYEVATYDRLYDEMLKWQGLPYPLAQAGLVAAERELKEEVVRSGSPGLSLAGYLMPAVMRVHVAGVKSNRTINLLRTVEALRLYANGHGKLPEKLSDVAEVPIPIDPFTDKPFDYRLDGATAILTAPPPVGEQPHEGNSRRYEITLSAKR
jgi:hypothetical protein